MKLKLACALLALLTAAGWLAAAHCSTHALSDDVTMTAETIYGDPACAQGVALDMQLDMDEHLLWDITFHPGLSPATQCRFTFRPSAPHTNRAAAPYAHLFFSDSMWASGVIPEDEQTFTDNYPQFAPFFAPIKALMESVPPGGSRTSAIRLKDHTDYFPLEMNFFSGSKYNFYSVTDNLGDAIRIAVPEDYYLNITLSRDINGQLDSMNINVPDGSSLCLDLIYIFDGEELYMTLPLQTQDSAGLPLKELAEFRDGYGIYRLTPSGDNDLTASLFAPLDDSCQVLGMDNSCEDGYLRLVTDEGGVLFLSVYELSSGRLVQKTDVAHSFSGDSCYFMFQEGTALFILPDLRLVLMAEGENGYEKRIESDYSVGKNVFSPTYYQLDTAYDGSRLAIVMSRDYPFNDIQLMVFDGNGPLYCAAISTSLQEALRYNCPAYFTDGGTPRVTFDGPRQ